MKFPKLFFTLLFLAAIARAEDRPPTPPERVVRDFYQWYVQALVQNRDPFTQDRAQLKRYVSERLLREIDHARKGPDGLDGDPFVDAQDFDKDWAKNISVSAPVINGKRATTVVELSGKEMGTRKLQVTLVQENGAWKVDKVEGQR
jgi:ABC-type transporter MlaC component